MHKRTNYSLNNISLNIQLEFQFINEFFDNSIPEIPYLQISKNKPTPESERIEAIRGANEDSADAEWEIYLENLSPPDEDY